jgi:hypothetical protein
VDPQRRTWPLTIAAVALAVAGLVMVAAGARPAPGPPAPAHPLTGTRAPQPSQVRSPGPVAGLVRSVPVELRIPRLGLATGLMSLSLNPDGTIEVPPLSRASSAGWYRGFASPGEAGTAVILGHVDSARYGPAVFFRLGTLQRGDLVSVRRADGVTAKFTVDAVGRYPKSAFPTGLVYGRSAYPALRLITCGGRFDQSERSYQDNVVVFASYTGPSDPAPAHHPDGNRPPR